MSEKITVTEAQKWLVKVGLDDMFIGNQKYTENGEAIVDSMLSLYVSDLMELWAKKQSGLIQPEKKCVDCNCFFNDEELVESGCQYLDVYIDNPDFFYCSEWQPKKEGE